MSYATGHRGGLFEYAERRNAIRRISCGRRRLVSVLGSVIVVSG
jgi:hypothetical protein